MSIFSLRSEAHLSRVGIAALVGLLLATCAKLPDNFQSLSLEEKVAAYEEFCNAGGRRQVFAQMQIAWHGWQAADLMAEYLNGKRTGIPILEAITIIDIVQGRGCSLQGSAAERALVNFLATDPQNVAHRMAAKNALLGIRENEFVPTQVQILPGGPCQGKREGKAEDPH